MRFLGYTLGDERVPVPPPARSPRKTSYACRMTRVGVTGHQRLQDPSAWPWVKEALSQALDALAPPLVGLTSLAAGADQLFADVVLERGGSIEVVLPFAEYRNVFRTEEDRASYDRL